jgi:hypothetical protein
MAHATVLAWTRRSTIAGLGILVLMAGFLSASADALLNHSGHYSHNQKTKCDSSIFSQHLVRDQADPKLPPCNACFLHYLVTHSLIPQADRNVPANPPCHFYATHDSSSSVFLCPEEEPRGPPSVRYL